VNPGEAPEPRLAGAKPALVITLALSAAYLLLAAVLVPMLNLDPQRVASNAIVASLPERAMTPSYLLFGVWQRFDTLWYRHIAEAGYTHSIEVVFYPLYPVFIRMAGWLGVPTEIGAILVVRVATFFLFWGLWRLWGLDETESTVMRGLALLVTWPMAFVLFGGYAEALLMCFTVWSIYFARRQWWWWAAVCGVLACLSRAAGMVVLAPLVWIAWRQRPLRWAPLLLALCGPVVFPVWLKLNGLPQAGQAYPLYWHTAMAWPWETLAHALRSSGEVPWFFGINAAAMVIVFGAALWRPGNWEYFWYALGMLCFLLTAKAEPALHSCVRYVLPVFPAFLALHRILHNAAAMLWVLLGVVQVLFLYSFWSWSFLI